MTYSVDELEQHVASCLTESDASVSITDEAKLHDSVIDYLLGAALYSTEDELKKRAEQLIHLLTTALHITSAPTTSLYEAFQKGEVSGFTVPAINLRIMPYEVACTIFSLMLKHDIGIVIFELARSEMGYSNQTPSDLAITVMAAAVKTGYSGTIFIQGDHYQVNKDAYSVDGVGELNKLKQLIIDSIKAQLYNIDIDASTNSKSKIVL
jgi:hypothetical protein